MLNRITVSNKIKRLSTTKYFKNNSFVKTSKKKRKKKLISYK